MGDHLGLKRSRAKTTARRHSSVATFSIVACDTVAGDLGIAVASKFLACGAVVPWASAGAGAVALQAYCNTASGPDAVGMMRDGLSAAETLDRLVADDLSRDLRQIALADARGGVAAYTGSGCLGWAGHRTGANFTCQGNLLAGEETVAAMATEFEASTGELSDRLVVALAAGQAAGGDRRGRQASALYVVRANGGYLGMNDVLVDLRVDDHPDPVKELRRILDLHHLYFGSSPAVEKLAIEGALLADLKQMMRQSGHYHGAEVGPWDDATARALDAFISTENLEQRVDLAARTIDLPAVAFLRRVFPRRRG